MTDANLPATIMVVDDTRLNLMLLDKLLSRVGYSVVTFTRGEPAIKAALKDPPDLVMLDIMMPGMNGYDVCRELKAQEQLNEIPIIFISALDDIQDKVAAFASGAVDYVTKPFQPEEVDARVKIHLTLSRQKKQLEENYSKLKELESMRDSLVHMIIHDMRSPLMGISGYLELAKMQPVSERLSGYLTKMEGSVDILAEMVNNLLDVSKMEAGGIDLEISAVDINELIRNVLEKFDVLVGQRALNFEAPDGEVTVACDARLIQRVIWNLVANAVKFTSAEDGEITVSVRKKADRVRVTVSDNGCGIPEECHDMIFDKFAQVKIREKGNKTSTGLGLTFSKLAVEAHGGKIILKSRVNQGSAFLFELPASGNKRHLT